MTTELKFPRPVTEYHRFTVGRHGRAWAVIGRIYTGVDGAPLTADRSHMVCGYNDDILAQDLNHLAAEGLLVKAVNLLDLARAMKQ